jgi:dihydrofolate reductase
MKNKLIGIVAMTKDGIIAIDSKLPVDSKIDMKHFKETTEGNIVIMGNSTYRTLGRQLPNRLNIVLTKSAINDDSLNRPYYTDSIMNAIRHHTVDDTRDLYVIGGAKIYRSMLPMCDEVIVTVFETTDETMVYENNLTIFPFGMRVLEHNDNHLIDLSINSYYPSLNHFFDDYEILKTFEENGITGHIIKFFKE